MRKILTILFLAIIQFLNAQNYTEILGRPTDSSITMNILFDKAVNVYWEYGLTPSSYTMNTNVYTTIADTPIEVNFTNLLPNVKYYYRTRYKLIGNSNYINGAEHYFQTQRKAGTSFRFMVEADPHLDSNTIEEAYRTSLRSMLLNRPDFLVDLGDNFMNDKLPNPSREEITKRNMLFRSFFNELNHSVPLYLTLGNHEGEVGFVNGVLDKIAKSAS